MVRTGLSISWEVALLDYWKRKDREDEAEKTRQRGWTRGRGTVDEEEHGNLAFAVRLEAYVFEVGALL